MVNSNRLHYDPKAKPHKYNTTSTIYTWFIAFFRFIVIFSFLCLSISYLMYGNFTFNLSLPSYTKIKHNYFMNDIVFTPETLSLYNGTDPTKPIYIAFSGDVYDVTAGRDHYGPNGGYSFFAGRDATRAFITGCFQTHLTHDIRGFTQQQINSINEWKQFYDHHDKYFRVGHIINPIIDPNSPIPPPCEDELGNPVHHNNNNNNNNHVYSNGQKPVDNH